MLCVCNLVSAAVLLLKDRKNAGKLKKNLAKNTELAE